MKKISVIVPVYNTEKYIERCINSILNQTYSNTEIILVDDGSTDNSNILIDRLASNNPNITVKHKKNGGQSSARNLGLEIATGDYIAFVDSDDWIEPYTLEYLVSILERENADICNIRCRIVTKYPIKAPSSKYQEKRYDGKSGLEKLMSEAVEGIPGSLGVVRGLYCAEILKTIRFVEGRINEDMVFCYEAYNKATSVVFSTRICYNYFMSSGSTTRGPLRQKELDLLWACQVLAELSKNEKYGKIKYYVDCKIARSDFSLLAKAAFYGVNKNELDERSLTRGLTKRLRRNFLLLISSPMSLQRKLIMSAFCMNFRIVNKLIRLYKTNRNE